MRKGNGKRGIRTLDTQGVCVLSRRRARRPRARRSAPGPCRTGRLACRRWASRSTPRAGTGQDPRGRRRAGVQLAAIAGSAGIVSVCESANETPASSRTTSTSTGCFASLEEGPGRAGTRFTLPRANDAGHGRPPTLRLLQHHHAGAPPAAPRLLRPRRERDRRDGRILGAIDLVRVENRDVVRDVTVACADAGARRGGRAAVEALEGVHVDSVSDRMFLLHLRRQDRRARKVPVKTRDDLSMAYTPGVARVCRRSTRTATASER